MCRKLIYLVSFVLVFGLVSDVSAELVGQWKLDEGSGTTALDATGNGNNGTLEDDPTVVDGQFGQALAFDNSRVTIGASDSLTADLFQGSFTLSAWINPTRTGNTWQQIFRAWREAGNSNDTLFINNDGRLSWRGLVGGAWAGGMCETAAGVVPADQWTHAAVTGDGTNFRIYVNGALSQESAFQTTDGSNATYYIGGDPGTAGESYMGMVDDLRVYNHVLSEDEIRSSMENQGGAIVKAYGPVPKNGALYADTWVSLSWRAGDFAVSHDVYMGENFDDVNEGAVDTFRGNLDLTYFIAGFPGYSYPDGLVPGTTYYWRIDEVNNAEPNSPWKGDVWSFSIPPKTAYYPIPAEGTEFVDLNVQLSWTAGYGAKLHYIVFGEDFDEVNNAAMGVPNGTTNYTPGPLKLAKTYYWRIDEYDGIETYKGEVWSFTTLGAVSGPNPADGAVDVKPSVVLSWDAGAVATSHEVYFGTDADAVKNATKTSPEYKGPKALGEESYDPGMLTFNSAYYWRIDEVNDASTDSPWAGNVWSFTTGDFFVIDDFEDYDAAANQIWYSWHDGLGYGAPGTVDYFAGNGTGAAVGDETTASYTEETIVNGGSQSMPISYDNNQQGYSK
ncbi:MAG: LamG domain-containing protein [Sedimentisphaerales bacterium]